MASNFKINLSSLIQICSMLFFPRPTPIQFRYIMYLNKLLAKYISLKWVAQKVPLSIAVVKHDLNCDWSYSHALKSISDKQFSTKFCWRKMSSYLPQIVAKFKNYLTKNGQFIFQRFIFLNQKNNEPKFKSKIRIRNFNKNKMSVRLWIETNSKVVFIYNSHLKFPL